MSLTIWLYFLLIPDHKYKHQNFLKVPALTQPLKFSSIFRIFKRKFYKVKVFFQII